jgi:hypothetical protein
VDLAFAIAGSFGLGEAKWEVVDADRAVVHVFQLRVFRDDGLDETGLASATRSDETDFATEHNFPGRLDVVNVRLRAVCTTLDNLEGDLGERKVVGEFLGPEGHADAERRCFFPNSATGYQLMTLGIPCSARRHEYLQRPQPRLGEAITITIALDAKVQRFPPFL